MLVFTRQRKKNAAMGMYVHFDRKEKKRVVNENLNDFVISQYCCC